MTIRTKGGGGSGSGVGGGGGSRYKVTARCVPEVNITSPPPIDGPLHKITSPQEQSSQQQQQQQQQQTSTSFAQQQLQCAKQFFSGKKVNNNYNYNNSTSNNSNSNNKNGINNNNNINNNHNSSHNLINGSSNNTSNSTSNGQKPSNKKHHFLLRSKQTNTIFSSGCTLVEEEDFNELTAVPNATIVIATNATTNNHQNHHHHLNTETRVAKSRHLPPLKLTSYAQTTTGILPSKLTNQTPTEAEAVAEAERLKKQTIVATIKTPTPIGRQNTPPTTITPKLDKEINAVTSKIAAVDVAAEATPINGFLNVSRQSSHETDDNSIAITNTTTTTTTNTHTITSYSQNSKTTRSWPVIYRNPQYYDYEALFAQATKQLQQQQQQRKKPQQQQQQQQVKIDNYKKKYQQQQQAYTNQFAQSILYSSSNEDLGSFNEDATPATSIGDVGKQTTCYYFTQTSSHHNSIYEQPSASTVVCNGALQTDLQWSSSAEEVQQLRRNSSFLLPRSQNNSYRRHQKRSNGNNNNRHYFNESNGDISNQFGCGVNDDTEKGLNNGKVDDEISPTSMNSGMDGGSNNTNSTACCSSCCMGPPPVLYLFVTLLMTTSATAMLCAAIMTDHWEHVIWDRESLDRYTNRSKLELEWIMEDKVAMLKTDKKDHRLRRDSVFLVPMHGGIWTLCIDLPLHELQELRRLPKFPRSAPPCVNYLANSMENARGEEQRNDWQHSESQTSLQPHLRMQNLSISCSLVCLIILGSAALVGAFGVCQRQISAILITGVMYLLAATFALFTLMIIHFKRQQGRPMLDSDYDGTVDGIVARPGGAIVAKPLLGARIFLTSWSLDLGWGGVVLCAIASMLWIFLSKIMRYNPLTLLLI